MGDQRLKRDSMFIEEATVSNHVGDSRGATACTGVDANGNERWL